MTEPYNGYYTQSELDAMKTEAARLERERCAKVCDDVADKAGDAPVSEYAGGVIQGAERCAAAIREGQG